MRRLAIIVAVGLALPLVVHAASVDAQGAATPAAKATPAPSQPQPDFAVVQGRWVRPDGGYAIAIRSVDSTGKLDAAYANPNPIPFAKAEVVRDGKEIRLFFELRAGGYNGSTYALVYDPAKDVLKGVYFQAVARQKFDVHFVRAK